MNNNYRRFNTKCIKIAVLFIPFIMFLMLALPFAFSFEKKGMYGFGIIMGLLICSIIYAIKRRGFKWE